MSIKRNIQLVKTENRKITYNVILRETPRQKSAGIGGKGNRKVKTGEKISKSRLYIQIVLAVLFTYLLIYIYHNYNNHYLPLSGEIYARIYIYIYIWFNKNIALFCLSTFIEQK